MQLRLLALAAAAGAVALTQQQQPARAPGNDTILKEQLKADLYFLAGDGMRGRLTGSREYGIAAEYIESRFARLGLKPAMGDSMFHRYDLVLSRLDETGPNKVRLETGPGAAREGKLLEDFYPLIFSADGEVSSPVRFLGYGIHAPAVDWDDYAGKSLAGTIAVILEGDPGANDPASRFDGVVTSEYSNSLRKTLWAQEHGAAGVVIVSASASRVTNAFPASARAYWPAKPPHLEKYTLAAYVNRLRIPAIQVSPAFGEALLRNSGKTLAQAAVEAEKGGGAAYWADDGQKLTIETRLKRTIVEDRNVVARVEGSDPKLREEAVIVSAHYDHNGADGDQIYNGADDNGSGAVALLEIAEAYAAAAAQGARPKRTVIFASWGSEERCCGPLLGAWAWVEDQAWPLDKTVATLNMDMIGRSEEVPELGAGRRFNGLAAQTAASNANNVNILGWSYSPDLSRLADEANHSSDLRLLRRYDNNRSQLLRRSDQWPFLQRRVPALFFHTGLHPDYHTVNDRPERIDYAKMERVARLVHQLSWNLANRDGRPAMPARRTIPPEQR